MDDINVATMHTEMIPTKELIPYAKNAKKHTKKQISNIAKSIEQYGFVQPIVLDSKNEIVIGHGRTLAAQLLGMESVPCVRVDYLTDEQIRVLRILDNKTNESEWIDNLVLDEIQDLPALELFDFDFPTIEDVIKQEAEKEKNKEDTQKKVENILNLGKGQYYSDNKWGFPELDPVYELPEIKEWIGFNYVLSDDNPEGKAVHFFIDDYQFERIWNNPDKYIDKLKQYVCVATPDFSPYGDMPLICQMYNHYRKHWVGAYLQEHGVTVIPTIRCSTDPQSLEWYLDGEPRHGICIYSTMWTTSVCDPEISHMEYLTMMDVLKPKKVFVYGGKGDVGIQDGDPVEYIDAFSARFKKGQSEE